MCIYFILTYILSFNIYLQWYVLQYNLHHIYKAIFSFRNIMSCVKLLNVSTLKLCIVKPIIQPDTRRQTAGKLIPALGLYITLNTVSCIHLALSYQQPRRAIYYIKYCCVLPLLPAIVLHRFNRIAIAAYRYGSLRSVKWAQLIALSIASYTGLTN